MDRRAFLAGLTASAAGLLIPERKIWALDQTMLPFDTRYPHSVAFPLQKIPPGDYNFYQQFWVREDVLYGQVSNGAIYAGNYGEKWVRIA